MIFGLGTGRCGSRSLAQMLNETQGIYAVHEQYILPWKPDMEKAINVIKDILTRTDRPIIASVAWYWLPYVESLFNIFDQSKFICIKRDRTKTVNSFLRSINSKASTHIIRHKFNSPESYDMKNYITPEAIAAADPFTREWMESAKNEIIEFSQYANAFPDYGIKNKKNYLMRYWDDYYETAESLQNKYPNSFRVFELEDALNTPEGRNSLLKFIGVAPDTTTQ